MTDHMSDRWGLNRQMNRAGGLVLMGVLVWLLCGASAWAQAQAPAPNPEEGSPPEPTIDPAQADRIFAGTFRTYARNYILHDDRYVCIPGYDPRLPSSRGLTANEVITRHTQVQRVVRDGHVVSVTLRPHADDAAAFATAIPTFEVGMYGHIHSGKVDSIDDDGITLREVWLIDATTLEAIRQQTQQIADQASRDEYDRMVRELRDRLRREGRYPTPQDLREVRQRARDTRQAHQTEAQAQYRFRAELADQQELFSDFTLRILGTPPRGAREGQRWQERGGTQLAIVAVEGRTVVAVPTSRLVPGLNELQFINMLRSRGYSVPQFVELHLAQRQTQPRDHLRQVVYTLERITPGEDGLPLRTAHVGEPDDGMTDEERARAERRAERRERLERLERERREREGGPMPEDRPRRRPRPER